MLYGIDAGCGFLAFIAAPGLGKTTLLFHLLKQLRERALTVFLFQTVCTPLDLLRALLHDLGVPDAQGSLVQMQSRLREVLVEQARLGKRVVLVIDEAQNLDDSVLELIRMLSNFETPREKLIQIVLSGQPRLGDKMAMPELEQLRQRVSIFSQLKPLSRQDTERYIAHRLQTAGYGTAAPLFTSEALGMIAEASGGIPRNVNNLCFNALALGCALRRKPIDRHVVLDVIDDLDCDRCRTRPTLNGRLLKAPPAGMRPRIPGWTPKFALGLALFLLLGGVLFFANRRWPNQKSTAVHAESVAPPLMATPPPQNAAPIPPMKAEPAWNEADNGTAEVAAEPDPPAPPASPVSGPAGAAATVSVLPGQTLREICVDSFGNCNPELLQRFIQVNPGLSNPNHIEPGQVIRLPVLDTP